MTLDLIVKNAILSDGDAGVPVDVGIAAGRIVAIEPALTGDGEIIDLGGRLIVPGFVESHIHLDKACILDRCRTEEGTLAEAIRETAAAKKSFTMADIRQRAVTVLEKAILQGTTRMRTHLEVDPVIGMQGIEAILPLRRDYAWAIDLEICVFPQEGMLNNPGTEALMLKALKAGATVLGGCPYTDSDPIGQIDRVFELAHEYDTDIDFHLDFDLDPQGMTLGHVCENAERFLWGGRVTVGHVSKLSVLAPDRLGTIATRMADTGVALTVLPSTDLFLMGGEGHTNIPRGVAPLHKMHQHGVNCALSTNNVLNPFTPFGDCSMIRMANLYANIARIGATRGHRDCLDFVTGGPARLMRLDDYGIRPGNPADFVVLDCNSAENAVREIATPLLGYKNGRRTFTRPAAELHRP
jgi:cytosine/creatinine deaminase